MPEFIIYKVVDGMMHFRHRDDRGRVRCDERLTPVAIRDTDKADALAERLLRHWPMKKVDADSSAGRLLSRGVVWTNRRGPTDGDAKAQG